MELSICVGGQKMAEKSFPKYDGYQGIWFTLGQFSEYGDKYSGGLGTYTAKHVPLAVYSAEAALPPSDPDPVIS